MPDYEQVLYSQQGRIVTVTLNRPERLNAWTMTMEREFIDAINRASADPGVGCIVVTGAGRGFCAGADLTAWASESREEYAEQVPALATTVEQEASPNLPLALAAGKPVIAAINGAAIGIGLTMSLACDIRIASTAARFSARFVRVGLIPESGSSYNLPQIAGIETAMELVLTGRIIDASDPLAAKLVSRIVPPDELMPTAYALAEEIAAGPANPVWLAKRSLRANASQPNLHQVVATETQLFAQVKHKFPHREAVAAFLERRDPQWHS